MCFHFLRGKRRTTTKGRATTGKFVRGKEKGVRISERPPTTEHTSQRITSIERIYEKSTKRIRLYYKDSTRSW